MAHLGEFELISRYFARTGARAVKSAGVELGIGDDAAVLRVPEARISSPPSIPSSKAAIFRPAANRAPLGTVRLPSI